MSFQEQLGWLLFGCLIGLILGYVVRGVQEKVENVDEKVKRVRNEKGLVRHPILLDILLAMVVILTAGAAFASAVVSEKVQDTQDRLAKVSFCNQQYLIAQAEFLSIYLEVPPATQQEMEAEFKEYVETLNRFIEADGSAISSEDTSRLPANADLEDCLQAAEERTNNG